MSFRTVIIMISAMLIGIYNNLPAFAMERTDCTSEKYLIDHGHSPEIIRMINLQKARTEENVPVQPPENKIKKFLKNLWFAQDLTMPSSDFGYSTVNTVETQKDLLPKDLTVPVQKYMDEKNKNKNKPDDKEIMINDVKVRDSK